MVRPSSESISVAQTNIKLAKKRRSTYAADHRSFLFCAVLLCTIY